MVHCAASFLSLLLLINSFLIRVSNGLFGQLCRDDMCLPFLIIFSLPWWVPLHYYLIHQMGAPAMYLLLDYLLIEFSIFFIVDLSKAHKSKSKVVSVISKRPDPSSMSTIFWRTVESFNATRRLYNWTRCVEEFCCPLLLPSLLSLGLILGLKRKWKQHFYFVIQCD